MAQTMGSCTRPGTKLHSWPQELCTDSSMPLRRAHYVKTKMSQESLFSLMSSGVT